MAKQNMIGYGRILGVIQTVLKYLQYTLFVYTFVVYKLE